MGKKEQIIENFKSAISSTVKSVAQSENLEVVFGNEKNKLIIQPIGIVALEFLTNYFDKIFSYEYTKTMEQQLDLISNNKILIHRTFSLRKL